MENYVKMFMLNEQGKKIVKDIPENLTSLYKNVGWDFVKEENKPTETKEIILGKSK